MEAPKYHHGGTNPGILCGQVGVTDINTINRQTDQHKDKVITVSHHIEFVWLSLQMKGLLSLGRGSPSFFSSLNYSAVLLHSFLYWPFMFLTFNQSDLKHAWFINLKNLKESFASCFFKTTTSTTFHYYYSDNVPLYSNVLANINHHNNWIILYITYYWVPLLLLCCQIHCCNHY